MGRLARFSLAPVKGMALLHPPIVELTTRGMPGNRRFYLIDEQGELFSGFDHGPLVSIVPTYDPDGEVLSLRFPDGTEVKDQALAEGAAVTTNFHGRSVRGRLLDGPWVEAVSGFTGRRLRMVRTDHDGDGADVEPLTIVSTESVRDLADRGRYDGELDPRRFRIDVEIEGSEPFEEDTWADRRVQLGSATIKVTGQIPRCRVTTQSPDSGVRDWDTLTQIAKYRPRIRGDGGIPFGMYARVETPGHIQVGDVVAPVGRAEPGSRLG